MAATRYLITGGSQGIGAALRVAIGRPRVSRRRVASSTRRPHLPITPWGESLLARHHRLVEGRLTG